MFGSTYVPISVVAHPFGRSYVLNSVLAGLDHLFVGHMFSLTTTRTRYRWAPATAQHLPPAAHATRCNCHNGDKQLFDMMSGII